MQDFILALKVLFPELEQERESVLKVYALKPFLEMQVLKSMDRIIKIMKDEKKRASQPASEPAKK